MPPAFSLFSPDTNVALGLWSVVLPLHFPLTAEWLAFCKRTPSLKLVSHDLWQQMWEFAKDADKDLSNYDEDGQRGEEAEESERSVGRVCVPTFNANTDCALCLSPGAWPVVIDEFAADFLKGKK